ncbi:MAG: SPASM domain-containing protein [Nitrospirae bacterium]|nr:SPASM domain-containing protein [Nitrospirota bacterium]
MNPDNLINPFIVHWDISSSGYGDDTISKVCDELIKSKIFVLNLRDLSNPVSTAAIGILDKLAKTNIKIRLTVKHDALERSMMRILQERRISLFTETDSIEKLQSPAAAVAGNVSFSLNKRNFHEIPAVVSCCSKNRIAELEFPIQRAEDGEIFYPAPDNIDRLDNELKAISFEKLKITVHDPFLWKVFNNKGPHEGMGCNGANTMVYVSPDLEVTPCPLLPVNMGHLQAETLKKIFSSAKRRQIRKELLAPPYECRECAIVDNCKGGCRGRTYILQETFDKKDPACRLQSF